MITALLLALAVQAQDSTPLTLQTLVDRALNTHPTVAAARASRARASAELAGARAQSLPSLIFDGGITRFQQPMIVAPLHGLDLQNPPLFDRTPYQAGLSVNWTLVDFGRRSAHIRAQAALNAAAGDALTGTEQQLMASTVHAYLAVLDARQLLAAQDRLAAALASAQSRTEQLEAQGKAARVDVLRIAAQAQSAWADRVTAASQLEVAERQLARLSHTGYAAIHASSLPALVLADSALLTAPDPRPELIAQAEQTSADVRTLEAQARAANDGVRAARATWFPALQVQGAYIDRGHMADNYSAEWQVGVAMSYPVFTGGARTSEVQRAAAEQRLAQAQVRSARLNVESDVDRNLAALREAHARVTALALAVAQSQEVERIEKLALDVGTVVQTDYLDAEARLFSAQAALIQARHAEIAARVDLARTLGELSQRWLATNVESQP